MKTASILGVSPLGFHRIAYTEWGIANSCRYDGIPVICVHGLTRNGRDFDNLADAMQAERQIFCPDMAGRGRSDWLGDPALYGYPQYVSDMAALIARTGSSSRNCSTRSCDRNAGRYSSSFLSYCSSPRSMLLDPCPC